MNRTTTPFKLFIFAFVVLTFASVSQAQASRTWIAGTGLDSDPCSRTAPCRTWSGAQSKTATGGEINAIDAVAAGPVTISKSLILDGSDAFASTSAPGATGILINAPGGNVIIRNIDINGGTTGVDGIRILQANSVIVENCKISGFTGIGIRWSPSTADGFLTVRNVSIENCLGGGVSVINSSGFGRALIENSIFHRGAFGVRAGTLAVVTVIDSAADGCTDGFLADSGAAQLNLERCSSTNNTAGVKVTNGGAIRVSNCVISNNITFGLSVISGIIETYGTNMIRGNPNSDAPTPVGQS